MTAEGPSADEFLARLADQRQELIRHLESLWWVFTASGNPAGMETDREVALRRAGAMGGMVVELVVVADLRDGRDQS